MRRRELLLAALGLGACGRSAPRSGDEQVPAVRREPARAGPGGRTGPGGRAGPGGLGPLGERSSIPVALRPAFDDRAHAPPPPQLAMEGEAGQSFAAFLGEDPPRPTAGARTLAILPIGDYPRGLIVDYASVRLVRSPDPTRLASFVEAWFGLPVRVLPPARDDALEALPTREREGLRQLDAEALLGWLAAQRPADACCVLALTLEDLFAADAAWVYGYASIARRVGVHSMLRYDPGFPDTDARGPDFEHRILTRALRVLAHESAHMFGLRHCPYYACVMNPTAGLEDLDRLPLRLCPVCLRKLWAATGMELVERWERLADLSERWGLDADHAWFRDRLRALGL